MEYQNYAFSEKSYFNGLKSKTLHTFAKIIKTIIMKSIKFSEKEIEFLIALYESEVQDAQAYIEQVKQILMKLRGGISLSAGDEIQLPKKRGRKPKAKDTVLSAEPKKRGRKPKVKEVSAEPKKRGRKPKVKEAEMKSEPKKRGRKPKVVAEKAAEIIEKPIKKKPSLKKAKVVKKAVKPRKPLKSPLPKVLPPPTPSPEPVTAEETKE